jgi:hypothetical protein
MLFHVRMDVHIPHDLDPEHRGEVVAPASVPVHGPQSHAAGHASLGRQRLTGTLLGRHLRVYARRCPLKADAGPEISGCRMSDGPPRCVFPSPVGSGCAIYR